VITTAAGPGSPGNIDEDIPAATAHLFLPNALALDRSGNLYLMEVGNISIRRIAADTGLIRTIAGSGSLGFSGDNGPATAAAMFPLLDSGLAVDASGDIYFSDGFNERVRKIAAASGIITTVAGTGIPGFSGNGGPARNARLSRPAGLAVDPDGHLFIVDSFNQQIRRVDAQTQIITTVAGNGRIGSSGDGGPATNAELSFPHSIVFDIRGDLLIADDINSRLRRVERATGIITTIAGTGEPGFSGDGGPATAAMLNFFIAGIAADSAGNVFFSDNGNDRIRAIRGPLP